MDVAAAQARHGGQQPAPATPGQAPVPRFTIGRRSDNELVLFDEQQQESWIVYPPRSGYDFLARRRPAKGVTLVEHHPWAPFSRSRDHQVHARDACLLHGLSCPANAAITAAVALGFDPFA